MQQRLQKLEGENRQGSGEERPGTIHHKGHELLQISYHMPTTCEICPKPVWHMFRPPPAYECKRSGGIHNLIIKRYMNDSIQVI
uniref:Uncharacterized protein n=1 Tax=Lutzomyia longipalpis TaxID=7200 RepID=A0A1B0CT54_LUTLO